MSDKKKVLVAPLDWGLGHATRCIPIIHELLNADFEVLIAAGGPVKKLLQLEFPQLRFLALEGYGIVYAGSKRGLWVRLLKQLPRILQRIKTENLWLREIVVTHDIHAVISDNRYGMYHPKLKSIFITHQLLIKAPLLQGALQYFNYRMINKFDECWIPDMETSPGLAGILSHPEKLPSLPRKYIGFLSRFKEAPPVPMQAQRILIILSGPEPQRTILENLLLRQLEQVGQIIVLIRGLPGEQKTIPGFENVQIINHLTAEALEIEIKQASLIIARAGYSTIMDLLTLKKKSILIPTPGQTEQEYLGTHLNRHRLAMCMPQASFNLLKAVAQAAAFPYESLDTAPNDLLTTAINSLKGSI